MDAWLAPFLAALPWAEQRRRAPFYVQGLLLPGERESAEPMAARVCPGQVQQLYHVVSASTWPHEQLERVPAERLPVLTARMTRSGDGPAPKLGGSGVGPCE